MAYLDRFLELSRASDPAEIKPMYVLEHNTTLEEEEELEHFESYEESSPVRIGNEAAGQLQLDVYGELVLAIYQYAWSDQELSAEDWAAVRQIVEFVYENWEETDAGIWEIRGEPSHVVHSKVMCWVALDRALALAEKGGFDAPEERRRSVREEIGETTIERGFDESIGEQGSFTQTFEGDALDTTGLLLPMSGFIGWDDRRTQGTIEAIRTHLTTEEGLVYRYRADDGLPGEEGAFLLCSFWLVDALALSGRLEEARELFDSILEHASPLGLLSEEVDPETGRLLGNFPQRPSATSASSTRHCTSKRPRRASTSNPSPRPTPSNPARRSPLLAARSRTTRRAILDRRPTVRRNTPREAGSAAVCYIT